ncbi:MAG: hypothetical protein OES25_09855 [Acidobacteriota bacterium]|nr:hypothetical protein [Acidobacteriota bacterium]
MSDLVWNFEDLERFARIEDAEVRFWAVDRLTRHFPDECCDAIAEHLLDDHEATPPLVARHLADHGTAQHHAMLVRGFRVLRGVTPGLCLRALARTGHPGVVEMAGEAFKRGDLNDQALAIVIDAIADLATPEARAVVQQFFEAQPELLVEPPALRGALALTETERLADLIGQLAVALRQRGPHRAGEAFRTLLDGLYIDDAAWCLRTGPSGRIEFRKTIKAIESGYDCDIFAAMGEETIQRIARVFRGEDPAEVVKALADWTLTACQDLPGENLPRRISGVVGALSSPSFLEVVPEFGRSLEQWLIGFHLSTMFAVARGMNIPLELQGARGDLNRLLELAELETAHLLDELPQAIAVVCEGDPERGHQAQEWCLRMLEAQGPFFPRVAALLILGELHAIHFIPEMIGYLSDENSYVFGAAERSLSKMGESILPATVAHIEAGTIEPEAGHSLMVLLCDLGTQASYEVISRFLEWFMEILGPGTAAEWASLFGTEELIDPFRDWLDEDPAMVGQSLLLLGGIHDVEIPEEEEIVRAIEDERARQAGGDEDGSAGGESDDGGYVM